MGFACEKRVCLREAAPLPSNRVAVEKPPAKSAPHSRLLFNLTRNFFHVLWCRYQRRHGGETGTSHGNGECRWLPCRQIKTNRPGLASITTGEHRDGCPTGVFGGDVGKKRGIRMGRGARGPVGNSGSASGSRRGFLGSRRSGKVYGAGGGRWRFHVAGFKEI